MKKQPSTEQEVKQAIEVILLPHEPELCDQLLTSRAVNVWA